MVCTDIAAMGLDVDDLNLTVNIGKAGEVGGVGFRVSYYNRVIKQLLVTICWG